jgi:hypothetical protein
MFAEILNEALADTKTVKSLILTGERLRSFVSSDQADHMALRANPVVAEIFRGIPDLSAWRMLDHCASLTRLYAVFERFIGKTVRAWLADMPNMWGVYKDLGETFRTVHRRGVAKVLMDLDKDRFSNLGVEDVVGGLLNAVNGNPVYSVLPEAFLSDTRSLKRDRIDELFAQVRLEGGWDWLSKHRYVTAFIDEVRGGQNTPDAELRGFVNYRNEAAHGAVDQVLGVGPLTEYADFVVVVCKAIDELVRWNWVRRCKDIGRAKVIGKVSERFRDNIVVAKMQKCEITDNMDVILFGQHYCYCAVIESIRVNDVPHNQLSVNGEIEVGLKLNIASQKQPDIVFIQQAEVVTA